MRNKQALVFSVLFLTGCGVYKYEELNCKSSAYGQCDTDEAIVLLDNENNKWKIDKNILHLVDKKTGLSRKAEKSLVIDFVIENPQFVAIYDKNIDLVTVHRRVRDYQRGAKDLKRGLLAVGGVFLVGVPAIADVEGYATKSLNECAASYIHEYEKLKSAIKSAAGETKSALQNKAMEKINLAFDCY